MSSRHCFHFAFLENYRFETRYKPREQSRIWKTKMDPFLELEETPESIGAMAALSAKATAQGAARFFADPIDIRRALIAKRETAGVDTPVGHGCSNVIEILENLYGYERPAWATHESQTLPYQLNWQMARLERLTEGGQ